MKMSLWIRLTAVSIAITLLFTVVFYFIFHRSAAGLAHETRKNVYLFLAHMIETPPYAQSMQRYQQWSQGAPVFNGDLWVLNEDGEVYATTGSRTVPDVWRKMQRPPSVHEMSFAIPPFSNFADFVLIRLAADKPIYLLVQPSHISSNRKLGQLELLLSIGALFCASFTGLAMMFIYLRSTSHEARHVMSELKKGNLQVRFAINPLDKIANLKLDFNAMAGEIENLVRQLQALERSRKNLLQELGHDLRTPLTSLRTAIDTLSLHRKQMTEAQLQEFHTVIQGELNYFVQLLENLFFVASLDVPDYESRQEPCNVYQLLASEINARKQVSALTWHINVGQENAMMVSGDAILLTRMLRNVLDNAMKNARSSVTVSLSAAPTEVQLTIADDGEGMTAAQIANFGVRRQLRLDGDIAQADKSLGLGSVIIKAIVGLQGGTMRIDSDKSANLNGSGTRITINLPR